MINLNMNDSRVTPRAPEIRDLFDRIAPVYDQLNNSLSMGQHRVWKLMAVKWSHASIGNICLDLCCGSGDLARLLARQAGTTGQVYGVDFSAQMLAVAQKTTETQYTQPKISWIEADALNLPFEDNYFDCATMGYGLRNVTDIPRCLQELYRVLKPGAKAAILDFHRPKQPLLAVFQQWYLENAVVPAAKQLNLTEEYAYIAPSLDRFPAGEEQVILAKKAGFTATHYPIALGMMGVLLVTKA